MMAEAQSCAFVVIFFVVTSKTLYKIQHPCVMPFWPIHIQTYYLNVYETKKYVSFFSLFCSPISGFIWDAFCKIKLYFLCVFVVSSELLQEVRIYPCPKNKVKVCDVIKIQDSNEKKKKRIRSFGHWVIFVSFCAYFS